MTAAVERYRSLVGETLERIVSTQGSAIARAAETIAAAVRRDGLVYAFGSGHSMLPAIEMHFRAGGLACVDVLHDPTFGRAERLPGYAAVLLEACPASERDVLLIVSHSGRNAVPIELALEAKRRGIPTIAVTSLAHSRSVAARHPSGLRLFEICDVAIDNCGPAGDAGLELEEGVWMGPTSTVAGAFVVNAIACAAAERLLAEGVRPPVLRSQNLDDGEAANQPLLERYRRRLRGL